MVIGGKRRRGEEIKAKIINQERLRKEYGREHQQGDKSKEKRNKEKGRNIRGKKKIGNGKCEKQKKREKYNKEEVQNMIKETHRGGIKQRLRCENTKQNSIRKDKGRS